VIVPFLDARPTLEGCMASLLDQTMPRDAYEVIFIDNNSTDGGAASVAARSEVRLLREPTVGVYAARNRGIRAARGEILAFTDPDCRPERDWLERIAAAMRAPDVGVLLGRRVPPAGGGLLALVMAYESQKAAYVTSSGRGEIVFGHANNMAVRREVMERVGPFPEVLRGGDTILVRRAVDAYGYHVVRYDPGATVCHLEVATLGDYYRKARVYGRSNEALRALIPFRPLSLGERWGVFRRTVEAQRWSPARGALLLAVLVPGLFCYEWGRCPRGASPSLTPGPGVARGTAPNAGGRSPD
jgi:glycosyltransferase involved in cell wall biosynthesis